MPCSICRQQPSHKSLTSTRFAVVRLWTALQETLFFITKSYRSGVFRTILIGTKPENSGVNMSTEMELYLLENGQKVRHNLQIERTIDDWTMVTTGSCCFLLNQIIKSLSFAWLLESDHQGYLVFVGAWMLLIYQVCRCVFMRTEAANPSSFSNFSLFFPHFSFFNSVFLFLMFFPSFSEEVSSSHIWLALCCDHSGLLFRFSLACSSSF